MTEIALLNNIGYCLQITFVVPCFGVHHILYNHHYVTIAPAE